MQNKAHADTCCSLCCGISNPVIDLTCPGILTALFYKLDTIDGHRLGCERTGSISLCKRACACDDVLEDGHIKIFLRQVGSVCDGKNHVSEIILG